MSEKPTNPIETEWIKINAMLDLKSLESRLDFALKSETRETLTKWIKSKRSKIKNPGTAPGNKTMNRPLQMSLIKPQCKNKTFQTKKHT